MDTANIMSLSEYEKRVWSNDETFKRVIKTSVNEKINQYAEVDDLTAKIRLI